LRTKRLTMPLIAGRQFGSIQCMFSSSFVGLSLNLAVGLSCVADVVEAAAAEHRTGQALPLVRAAEQARRVQSFGPVRYQWLARQ
jgi:hypothetical protein